MLEGAGSRFAVAVFEPDSGNTWRAVGLSLLDTALVNDTPAQLRWRLDLVDRTTGKVLLSWKETRASTMLTKEALERDLREFDVGSFRREWNV